MPSGPSKALEAIVGFFVPPACREEVLGDLHEKYSGTAQYILLALQVVPCVIVSRIWRTTDIFVLLTEALLIYGSFLAAVWYTDKAQLTDPWELVRLGIPTVLNVVALALEHAWDFEARWPLMLIRGGAIGVSIAFNVYGACAGLLLVSAVEILFRPGANLPQQGAGGPVFWLKQRSESASVSSGTKFSIAVAVVITLEAIIQAVTGVRPATVGAVIIIIAVIGVQLSRSRKQ
jgi:hypothetical protein